MIEVKNLTKVYGDHTAVNNLSFSVESGQIYGFLGPNGAGKSTTMNIMTGYIAPTSGDVVIDGHDILEEPEEAKKCIGYLPEQPPIYNDMTVSEYLKFCAELKGIPLKERTSAIDDAINATKLTPMKDRLIRNLSKGYKQRTGFAQAILGYPDEIILDEPTVGLDPMQIIEIRDLIRQLSRQHTVILSSHILSEVSAVCDHILIISHGNLVASDTPDNLEKLMKNSSSLDVEVKGDRNQILKILAGINGIQEQEIRSLPNDLQHITVKTDVDRDIREELFYALAKANCPIYMMNEETMSLEDVFLELTAPTKEEEEKKARRRFGRRRNHPAEETVAASSGSDFSGKGEM